MMKICVNRPRRANYTPADLMFSYAKDHAWNGVKAERIAEYGELALRIEGKLYRYHHWAINELPTGMDNITLYLEEI